MRANRVEGWALIALLMAGCGDGAPRCVPNETRACLCPPDVDGVQVCDASGEAYGACDCGAPPMDAGSTDAAAPIDAGDAPDAASEACPADRPWECLLENMMGFAAAAGTTGGVGATGEQLITVTNADASGPGSLPHALREVASDAPTWIRFDLGDAPVNIDMGGAIVTVPPNTTIDGRGANVTLDRVRLSLSTNNVIHGLRFGAYTVQDYVLITEGDDQIWIDHCTFLGPTEGNDAVNISTGAPSGEAPDGITLSWCHFEGQDVDKGLNIGWDDSHVADRATTVTLAYNYYDGIVSRAPLLRHARVHSYNNLHRQWRGVTGAVGLGTGARYVSERNLYDSDGTGLGPAADLALRNANGDAEFSSIEDELEAGSVRCRVDDAAGPGFDTAAAYAEYPHAARVAPAPADDALRARLEANVGQRADPRW